MPCKCSKWHGILSVCSRLFVHFNIYLLWPHQSCWSTYNNNNNNKQIYKAPCVCLQKAAEALVRCRSDSLVTAIKTGSRKMSFKTIVQIVQHDFCRQTVPNDRCGIGVAYLCSHRVSRTSVLEETHPRLFQLLQTILGTVHGTCSACVHCVMIQTVPSVD